jgi:hypothetical protein
VTRLALDRIARTALAFLALAGLNSCGSGAVSGPPASTTTLSISPSTATLYSDQPTIFAVTGGTGTYFVTSSDQAAVPLVTSFSGNTLTVVPNPVITDTPVTLTVRDSGTAAPVTAALTVKPRTLSNVVTVTPSASQSAACGSAICAGGDAEVKVTLAQGGVPLVGRSVRFDVVSGDFRIISSDPGLQESTSLSATVVTDATGTARIRVRVLSDASAQTGLLQITDVGSGSTQRTGIPIAPSSNAPLNAQPNTIVFQGVQANTCASGISADVIVFGGRPPYSISQPGSFQVAPTLVTNNPGRFTVTAIGQCSAGSQIAVVDGNGATVTVTASNVLSAVQPAPTPTVPTFTVSPGSVTLASCGDVANVAITGGSGSYFAASGNSQVTAIVTGNAGVIRRLRNSVPPGPQTAPASVDVAFSDGITSRIVNVTVTGPAGGC